MLSFVSVPRVEFEESNTVVAEKSMSQPRLSLVVAIMFTCLFLTAFAMSRSALAPNCQMKFTGMYGPYVQITDLVYCEGACPGESDACAISVTDSNAIPGYDYRAVCFCGEDVAQSGPCAAVVGFHFDDSAEPPIIDNWNFFCQTVNCALECAKDTSSPPAAGSPLCRCPTGG